MSTGATDPDPDDGVPSRFQVDFAGAGRLSRDSTVNGFAVTDASDPQSDTMVKEITPVT